MSSGGAGSGWQQFNKYVTYSYDSSGSRIAAQPWGMATTTFPTKEFNTDGTKKTGHLFANGSDVGTIETATSTPAIFWNHGDHLRSTSLVTDVSGAISEDVRYAPFGKIVENTGAHREQRKFTGHEYDSHAPTNYSYAEARYLDMMRGRFISEDPSFIYNPEKFLADTQQQNSYAYARNNPIRFVDPDGATIAEAAGGFATNLILAPFVLPLWVASAVFQPAAAWNQVSGAASTLQQNAAAFADNPGATLEATVQSYNNLSDTEKGGLAGIIAATIVVPGIAGKLELGIESDPMLYRTMKMGPDGLPMTGESARTLGVRIGEGKDITQGADGLVHPGTGGMSVTPNDPANMPTRFRPTSLGGANKDPLWCIRCSDLPPGLRYRPDPKNPTGHGFIEPSYGMSPGKLDSLIGSTKSLWNL